MSLSFKYAVRRLRQKKRKARIHNKNRRKFDKGKQATLDNRTVETRKYGHIFYEVTGGISKK